jgi:hypothetical protein
MSSIIKTLILVSFASVLLVSSGVSTADAIPYAYSEQRVIQLEVNAFGGTITLGQRVTTNSFNFAGCDCALADMQSAALDAKEAVSGGPSNPQNLETPFPNVNGPLAGSLSDSLIRPGLVYDPVNNFPTAPPTPPTLGASQPLNDVVLFQYNYAEGRAPAGVTVAGSNASVSATLPITIKGTVANTTRLEFAFYEQRDLQVLTGPGESATASILNDLQLIDDNGGVDAGKIVFEFLPSGRAGKGDVFCDPTLSYACGGTSAADAYNLQITLTSLNGRGDAPIMDPAPTGMGDVGYFEALSLAIPDGTYQVKLMQEESQQVRVPEPSSALLFALGWVGLLSRSLRQRRRTTLLAGPAAPRTPPGR